MIDFRDLTTIPGFRWGFQVDQRGDYHFSQPHPAGGPDHNRARAFLQLWQTLPQDVFLADYSFRNGRVFVRVVTDGIIVLFCDKLVRRSIISTALDALIHHPEASTILSPPPTHSLRPAPPPAVTPPPPPTDSGSITRISLTGEAVNPAAPLPEDVVRDLLAYFTEEIGPLAPMIARKTAKKAGIDLAAVVLGQWSGLLNALADIIVNPEKRERFLDKAVLLRKRF